MDRLASGVAFVPVMPYRGAGTPVNPLVVAKSVTGSRPDSANWCDVSRFDCFSGTLPVPVPRADLPLAEVFDPSGVTFPTVTVLFTCTRHGNVYGAVTIDDLLFVLDRFGTGC